MSKRSTAGTGRRRPRGAKIETAKAEIEREGDFGCSLGMRRNQMSEIARIGAPFSFVLAVSGAQGARLSSRSLIDKVEGDRPWEVRLEAELGRNEAGR